MTLRYVIRPEPEGFRVTDMWTGQPATLAMTLQTGLSQEDAEHTAALLNEASTERDAATS